jgi:hypothetical protein
VPTRSIGSATHEAGSGAIISRCGVYRYLLLRTVSDTNSGTCLFVMLNPSTADAEIDDATVRRCVDFTRRWGYGELRIVNLFALRSADPLHLAAVPDPIGPGNDEVIRAELTTADIVVVAWGNQGAFRKRSLQVLRLLAGSGIKAWHLGLNKSGEPLHPLFVQSGSRLLPLTHDVLGS